MTRRTDWATDQARRIVDLTADLSPEVAVNYVASELRVAFQRGLVDGIDKARAVVAAKPPAKETLV